MSKQRTEEVVVDLGDYRVTCCVLAKAGVWLMLRRSDSPQAAPFVRSSTKLPDCEFNDWVRPNRKATHD